MQSASCCFLQRNERRRWFAYADIESLADDGRVSGDIFTTMPIKALARFHEEKIGCFELLQRRFFVRQLWRIRERRRLCPMGHHVLTVMLQP